MAKQESFQVFQSLLRNAAVGLFGLVAKSGVHRLPLVDRAFLGLYGIYKEYVEAGPIDRLREFVPEGSLVIDVGANVGFFALRFAEWVGPKGKVIAIEPEDRNFESLIASLRRKDLIGRVEARKAVAAAASGPTFLEINAVHPADHKLSRDGTGLAVDAVTLDQLVPDKRSLHPGLIKIDVQGAEMLVLQGAAEILRQSGPALFIELHEVGLARFDTSVAAILDHLSEYAYQPYWLVKTGPHRKTTPEEIHAGVARSGYVDVLFLKAKQPS